MRRIGLFGGTFNPVHLGHVRAALDVQAALSLDQVVLIPSALPPHKPALDLAPGPDRLAMIRLAIAAHPTLKVSDMELQRPGPSYTIDTVTLFGQQGGRADRFVFIVGLDAFLEMNGWHRFGDIFKTIEVAVIPRPGHPAGPAVKPQVAAFLRQNVSARFDWQDAGFRAPGFCPVTLTAVTPVDISATRIRALVAGGRPIAAFVHPAVERHIQHKGLYR